MEGPKARRREGNEEENEGERHAVQGASLVANMAAAGLLQVSRSLFLIVSNIQICTPCGCALYAGPLLLSCKQATSAVCKQAYVANKGCRTC